MTQNHADAGPITGKSPTGTPSTPSDESLVESEAPAAYVRRSSRNRSARRPVYTESTSPPGAKAFLAESRWIGASQSFVSRLVESRSTPGGGARTYSLLSTPAGLVLPLVGTPASVEAGEDCSHKATFTSAIWGIHAVDSRQGLVECAGLGPGLMVDEATFSFAANSIFTAYCVLT